MRATGITTYRSLLAFFDRTSERMQELQLAAATGKRLNRPSDDPTAISPVLSARTQIKSSDRYIETIESGLDRIDNMDGYLDSIENTLVRAKEIAIASVNGTLNQKDLNAYADEASQLRASLLSDVNTQLDGKYVFSGFAENTQPFTLNSSYDPSTYDPADPTTYPVLYQGDQGRLEFEVAPNELLNVNISGNVLMQGDANNDGSKDAAAVDVFTVLTQLEENLRSGDIAALGTSIDDLETAADQVRVQRSLKGNIGRRLETARGHMEQIKVDMEEFRSRFEDADILKTITDLQQQQQSFQAALNVTGKVSELSILDYL